MGGICSPRQQLIIIWVALCFNCILSPSHASKQMSPPDLSRLKAVNLGGWLLVEGWIKPSLFDAIPNNDFLDGTGLQFKSVRVGKYLCPEGGGGNILVVNRTSASGWETFKLWRINEANFHLRVFSKQFVGVNTVAGSTGSDAVVVATSTKPGPLETFEIVRKTRDSTRVRIKSSNGFFLQARSEVLVTADYSVEDDEWGNDDPSVFVMTIADKMQGEFQLINGYGQKAAARVLRQHWRTFIMEKDFKFIAENGINAVRIPVGWWIASEKPPYPYLSGSLQALDNAFTWALKYGVQVIVDLHAAPESQNGWEHSGSRDGSQEWGLTDENIHQTVQVIDFLTARYVKNPRLYAIELINEPRSPGVTLRNLAKYYQAGYNAVRKYSNTTYVVLSNRMGSLVDEKELFPLAARLSRVVIDVHYYSLFDPKFDNMTVQQNIEFIRTNRSTDITHLTNSYGPLTFVGEWVAEWQVRNASKEDLEQFGKAQMEVFGRASFGWAYWTYKNVNLHWSLEWMISNGYIKLT